MSDAASAFLDRVFTNNPSSTRSRFEFQSWRTAGRPTSEGFGVLPTSGVDVDRFIDAVMDLDHYRGNIDHVLQSRSIADASLAAGSTRFYQQVNVPGLTKMHMELVITDFGVRDGWRVAAWRQLDAETAALSPRDGARTQYNIGAWLIRPDAIGYALSSAPRKEDVGRLKFAALTRGADAAASRVIKANIEGMLAWSRRR